MKTDQLKEIIKEWAKERGIDYATIEVSIALPKGICQFFSVSKKKEEIND